MDGFSEIDAQLLNDFQHNFPLVRRPFRKIGTQLGIAEEEVIDRLDGLSASGVISRIGPVFSPGCIGASTLAALAVPADRLEEMALWINALPEVNHNYQREHAYNLWFVATAPDQDWLDHVLARIARHTACPLLILPLVERFHIDLGFDLRGNDRTPRNMGRRGSIQLSSAQAAIVSVVQSGIRLVPEPFAEVSRHVRMAEDYVLEQMIKWSEQGVIKRFGVVVRHHELGYRENAMVVWDVPDAEAGRLGKLAAQQEGVTLCYQRERQLPDWPYNLYCMVHGKERAPVQEQIGRLASNSGLQAFPSQTLFSCRRFKQHGAQYVQSGT